MTTHGGCSVRPVGRILFRPGSTGIFSVGGGQTRGGVGGCGPGRSGGSEQLRFLSRSEGENLQQTVVLLWRQTEECDGAADTQRLSAAPGVTSRTRRPKPQGHHDLQQKRGRRGRGDRSPDRWVAGTPLEDHQPLTAHNQSVDFNRRCLTGRSGLTGSEQKVNRK